MTNDFGITETTTATEFDQRWMASNSGLSTGFSKTLDLSAAKGIAGVLTKNGDVRSGVAVGRITGTEHYGLFDGAATDGRQVLAGFVAADINVVDAKGAVQASGKAPFSLLTRVDVKTKFLPVVAQRTITAATANTGQFVFVD